MIEKIFMQLYPSLPRAYTAIVADGLFPKHIYLQNLIQNASTVIACDGALEKLLAHNIVPNYIVGDCDSISPKLHSAFQKKIIKIEEQDTNDLTKAIFFAKKNHHTTLLIFGATGLREDHTIANVGILSEYMNVVETMIFISDDGILTAYDKNVSVTSVVGQQVSVFTTFETTKISCNELKWKLNNKQLKYWHHGTLNEAVDSMLHFNIVNGTMILYRSFVINQPPTFTADKVS